MSLPLQLKNLNSLGEKDYLAGHSGTIWLLLPSNLPVEDPHSCTLLILLSKNQITFIAVASSASFFC